MGRVAQVIAGGNRATFRGAPMTKEKDPTDVLHRPSLRGGGTSYIPQGTLLTHVQKFFLRNFQILLYFGKRCVIIYVEESEKLLRLYSSCQVAQKLI